MEAILQQAKQLEGAIHELEQRKQRLQKEVKHLEEECELKQSELAEHTRRYAQLNEFAPAGDDVLTLDVAGEIVHSYRSTLQQVEGSVLSTLASGRWQNLPGSADGRIFLDCDPKSFQEIMDFLRELRVDRCATSRFTPKAARLADYLGIPVGRVLEDLYVMADFQRTGDSKIAPGFMFDVMISGPWQCTLRAIHFSMGHAGQAKLFVRPGSCLDSQTSLDGWRQLCQEPVIVGRNRLPVPKNEAVLVGPSAVLGIYLSFSEGADDLLYSDKPSGSNHKVLSEHRVLSEGMKLVCLRGRVSGSAPFSVGSHADDRFFVGNIEYTLE